MSKTEALASWPPGAIPGGTYTVQVGEESFIKDTLTLPDNFTVLFDPQISNVDWTFTDFFFGNSCVIDLSAPSAPPPTAASGTDIGGQAPTGGTGMWGGNGGRGMDGRGGTRFSLTIINQIPATGSLWIRTDGQPGGNGGRGGNAQMGGGSTCGQGIGQGSQNGGDGGTGGRGGNGGVGGSTSIVVIRYDGSTINPAQCTGGTSPSNAPPNFGNNDGRVIVWGAPGKGGSPGAGGAAGPGGGNYINCGWGTPDVHSGHPGANGIGGGPGASGKCNGSIMLKGRLKR